MLTVIKFGASWCGPCKGYTPIFEKVVKEFEDNIISKEIDIEENVDMAEKYHIMQVPCTIILDEGGVVLKKESGSLTAQNLKSIIIQCI